MCGGATPACRALFGNATSASQPKAAPDEPVEEMSNDPEAGMRKLSSLMRQFNDAVADKQFDVANQLITRAEKGIDRASTVTRSHPDFDDMADDVHRGRPRLELAIENDRIARRNAAIDALIEQGKQLMARNGTWPTELANRTASPEDLQQMDEALHAFDGLKADGQQYMDEPRYRVHATERDTLASRIMQAETRAKRQVQIVSFVGPTIEAGFAAADKARAATTPDEQLQAFKDVSKNFTECARAIAEQQRLPDFDGNLPLDTRFGHLSIVKTYTQCTNGMTKANEKVSRFGWDVLVQKLNQLVPSARGTGQAANAAQNDALHALADCAEAVPGKLAGELEKKAVFETVLGKLKVAALMQACGKEANKLKARGGVVGWQSRLEDVSARAKVAQGAATQATAPDTLPAAQVELLGQAAGGLSECAERADAMVKESLADKKFKVSSAFGMVTAQELSAACKRANADVQKRLPVAITAKKQAEFAATCHGDETAVVQREGVPTSIETVGTGRVFVYAAKRIAFDAAGMRTDETLLRAAKP